jgi:hypothetical protein
VRLPAERRQPADIQQLARGAVRARGVEADLALEPDHAGNEARQLRNGHVAADADIDGARIGVMPEQVHEGVGAIVHMQEFPARRAGEFRDLGVAGERRRPQERRSLGARTPPTTPPDFPVAGSLGRRSSNSLPPISFAG